MSRFVNLRQKLNTYSGNVMSKLCKILDKKKQKKLEIGQLFGIPCKHVIATINSRLEQRQDYVHGFYKGECYEVCYSAQISSINGQQNVA